MRTKMIKLILVLALGVIISLPSMASAFTLTRYAEDGGGINFDRLEVFMMAGTDLTSPAIINFGKGPIDWETNVVNPTYSLSTGTITSYIESDFQLPDPKSNSLIFDYLVWSGDDFLYGQRMRWNVDGSNKLDYSWYLTELKPGEEFTQYKSDGFRYNYNGTIGFYDRSDPLDCPPAVVPLPPTVLLLGSGLLGLGFLPRRKKKSEV